MTESSLLAGGAAKTATALEGSLGLTGGCWAAAFRCERNAIVTPATTHEPFFREGAAAAIDEGSRHISID